VGGWKADSIFTRCNIVNEEDLRDAMEKVTKYNEEESKRVVTMEASR